VTVRVAYGSTHSYKNLFSAGINRPEPTTGQLSPSSAEVCNAWGRIFTALPGLCCVFIRFRHTMYIMHVLSYKISAGPHQRNSFQIPTGIMIIFYCLKFETPQTWSARSPYLYHTVAGWPSYTPRRRVPFPSPTTTRKNYGGGIRTRLHTGYYSLHTHSLPQN
jgi:hypothetical protein